MRDATEDSFRLSELRIHQQRIKSQRTKLMNQAAALTDKWHELDNECRQIEKNIPLSKEALAWIAEDPVNRRARRRSARKKLSSHHIKSFSESENTLHLLFALESAIREGEPIPETCGFWFTSASALYRDGLMDMQQGGATPCIAELLSIPSPTKPTSVTKPIKRYFDEIRNESIKYDLAFFMVCFENLEYTEASEILIKHGRFIPRGGSDSLSDSFGSAAAMRKALGSGREIKKNYGERYRKMTFDQIARYLEGLTAEPNKIKELKSRIVTPVSSSQD